MTDQGSGVKLANNFMEVMKGTPLILALVVMNFAMIGLVYLQASQFNTQRKDNIELFVKVQGEVQKLLSQCIVPPPK
jgi:membrane-anchored glycerophosphoryl diester phosphodiesterase (GDPDase)